MFFSIDSEKKEIMRHLSQKDFCIQTKRLIELQKELELWITIDVPGAIIYGLPRVGKTTAITYLQNNFGKVYGSDIPVIRWDITEHTVTEKGFYSSFMDTIGLPDPKFRDTALILKKRIVNTLVTLGLETKYRLIILLIDEASLLDRRDFVWLMDMYNSLYHHDVLLITFLFGTYDLKNMKKALKVNGETQIIGRFMTREYVFKGICDIDELQQCLLGLDQPMTIDALGGRTIILPEYFFPTAFADNKFFSSNLTTIFWNAFNNVKASYGIAFDDDIPMQYFLTSFKHCLTVCGKGGPREKYFPEEKDLEECILESGYVEMNGNKSKNNRGKRK